MFVEQMLWSTGNQGAESKIPDEEFEQIWLEFDLDGSG